MSLHCRLIFVTLVLLLSGCASHSYLENSNRAQVYTMNMEPTALTNSLLSSRPNEELSGFHPLNDGLDAFTARIVLLEQAQSSVDIQYYLYHREKTGILLTKAILDAADRGVRIRLLLDDMSQGDKENELLALTEHANIDVRLFNPLSHRNVRMLSFVTDYSRVSRRMHNKSFIVDGQLFIVGGRNIGDAYFSGDEGAQFVDLDVLGVGRLTNKVAHGFDLYWNNALATDITELANKDDDNDLSALRDKLNSYRQQLESDDKYIAHIENSKIATHIREGSLPLEWSEGYFYIDDPNKLLTDTDDATTHMAPKLFKQMGPPQKSVKIISPYFIPRESGMEMIRGWRNAGVDVTILTNSLVATDVPVVYAGYADYREELLSLGVKLWELKRNVMLADIQKDKASLSGSSSASLHAKTMIMDDDRIFIGSLNLDPRSFNLNTEQGVLIYSQKLNKIIDGWMSKQMPTLAWQLTLDDDDNLRWIDTEQGVEFDNEPQASSWLRFKTWFMSLLPIESSL